MNKMKKNDKGFTLVELVIVIAILAVLAALLVPRIMGNVEDAKRASEAADARSIASEISTANALAEDRTALPAPEGEYYEGKFPISNDDIRKNLGREPSDFNFKKYARIEVDSEGNATVLIAPDGEHFDN